MKISKISKRSIYDEITKQLQQLIINGTFKPGQKLPSTKQLAEKFDVGRSTMREALSALKAMGLIDIRQGEGCIVRQFDSVNMNLSELQSLHISQTVLLELLEARKALEVANAGLAAAKRTEEDLQTFQKLLQTMKHHLGNEVEGERMDLQFHTALAKATHNSIMVRLLETISNQMETAIRETRRLYMYSDRFVSEKLWQEHQAIYEAIEKQDVEAAMETMRNHLYHVEQVLTKYLHT